MGEKRKRGKKGKGEKKIENFRNGLAWEEVDEGVVWDILAEGADTEE